MTNLEAPVSVTAECSKLDEPLAVTAEPGETAATRKAWAETEARRQTLGNAQRIKSVAEQDPALAALMRQMFGRTEARQAIAWAAARHGQWCGLCAEDLGDAVYWRSVPFAGTTVPLCSTCEPNQYGWYPRLGTCSCGRSVYSRRHQSRGHLDGYRYTYQRAYCCDDHRAEQVNAARRAARERRRRTVCTVCGDTFTPPRSDGRYCSAACRQKAYRRRARDGHAQP